MTESRKGNAKDEDWFMSPHVINALAVGKVGVDGLKHEISRRGLVPKGKKEELRIMLQDCMNHKMPVVEGATQNMKELSGFPVVSRWKVLESSSITPEPMNTFVFYEPTANTNHLNEPTLPKQNFDEEWIRPDFTGRIENSDEERVKGESRAKWLWEARLVVTSHPVEWVDAMVPVYEKYGKHRGQTPYELSISKLCNWSNIKASLMEMGTKTLYPSFRPFTTSE